ncbi:MAG: helix-turn-helix domain-containing protein [Mycobacterium sp.]
MPTLAHYTIFERIAAGKKREKLLAATKEATRIAQVMARSARAEGVPKTQICAELGVSRPTLDAWLRQ